MAFRNSAVFLLVAVIGAVVLFGRVPESSYADESESDAPVDNQLFDGKIVLFRVDRSSAVETKESSKTLKNVVVQEIGGRFFVTGQVYVPEDPDFDDYIAMRDVSAGIAWEKVSEFQAFTEEQYLGYIKWWREHRDE